MSRPTSSRISLGAALPLIAALLLTACADEQSTIAVSLANLADTPATYEGRMVRTEGVVHGFDDPRHYWIEDDRLNRVALIPEEMASDLVGQQVVAEGEFVREPRGGRQLRLSRIEPLPAE